MSCGKTTDDLHTSINLFSPTPTSELTNLLNDSFTCCMRNYEALQPYLDKKETKPQIHHKLDKIKTLLNKLNEELVGLRVECVTVSSYEQKSEAVLTEGSRKRRNSDVPEVGRSEAKSTKTEMPFSINTKCSITLLSGIGINMQSENFVSMDTGEVKHAQTQKSPTHCPKNIESEIQDSDEVVDSLKLNGDNSEIRAAQTLCDTVNIGMTLHVDGGEEKASVKGKLVEGNMYNTPAGTITQTENNGGHVPLQNIESEMSNQEKSGDSGNVLSKSSDTDGGLQEEVGCTTSDQAERPFDCKESPVDLTTHDKKPAKLVDGKENSCTTIPLRGPRCPMTDGKICVYRLEAQRIEARRMYGVLSLESGKYRCTLCDREFCDYNTVFGHANSKRHHLQTKIAMTNCPRDPDVSNKSFESTGSVSVNSGVSCSLADTVAVVEDTHEATSLIHAVRVKDMWAHFHVPFYSNINFFTVISGKVVCLLCYEKIGSYILNVKTHISRKTHHNRIKVLQNIELEHRTTKKWLMDVPGIMQNIIPRSQFTYYFKNSGFFCTLCKCYCGNSIVLRHLTGVGHARKLEEIKK